MVFIRSMLVAQLSDVMERIQRLEREQGELRARIERDAALRRMTAQVSAAAHAAPVLGSALEAFANAMRRPLKRGRAGGIARAHQAKRLSARWTDGRYMSHDDWEQVEREITEAEYLRYAAGGFARAASAVRATDGTFLPSRNF